MHIENKDLAAIKSLFRKKQSLSFFLFGKSIYSPFKKKKIKKIKKSNAIPPPNFDK
jgi:hypothetical protein